MRFKCFIFCFEKGRGVWQLNTENRKRFVVIMYISFSGPFLVFFPHSFNTVLILILHLTYLVFFNRVVLASSVWHPALREHFPTSQSNFHFKHISWTLKLFYKSSLMFCLWISRQGAFCLFICSARVFFFTSFKL